MVNSDSDSDEFPFPEFETNGEFVDPENKRIRNTNDVGVQFPELISPRNEQRLPESETNSEPEPIQQVSELNARRSNNLRRVQTGMVRKMNMVKMLRSVRRFIGGARYHSRADRRGLVNIQNVTQPESLSSGDESDPLIADSIPSQNETDMLPEDIEMGQASLDESRGPDFPDFPTGAETESSGPGVLDSGIENLSRMITAQFLDDSDVGWMTHRNEQDETRETAGQDFVTIEIENEFILSEPQESNPTFEDEIISQHENIPLEETVDAILERPTTLGSFEEVPSEYSGSTKTLPPNDLDSGSTSSEDLLYELNNQDSGIEYELFGSIRTLPPNDLDSGSTSSEDVLYELNIQDSGIGHELFGSIRTLPPNDLDSGSTSSEAVSSELGSFESDCSETSKKAKGSEGGAEKEYDDLIGALETLTPNDWNAEALSFELGNQDSDKDKDDESFMEIRAPQNSPNDSDVPSEVSFDSSVAIRSRPPSDFDWSSSDCSETPEKAKGPDGGTTQEHDELIGAIGTPSPNNSHLEAVSSELDNQEKDDKLFEKLRTLQNSPNDSEVDFPETAVQDDSIEDDPDTIMDIIAMLVLERPSRMHVRIGAGTYEWRKNKPDDESNDIVTWTYTGTSGRTEFSISWYTTESSVALLNDNADRVVLQHIKEAIGESVGHKLVTRTTAAERQATRSLQKKREHESIQSIILRIAEKLSDAQAKVDEFRKDIESYEEKLNRKYSD
ncbi:uncharacterized protein [Drosophila suzukii]|uniref:Uncharacterized protein isoform X2 n=1 Tax=Drosophila suzukii TaxID=28584 RepID=A0AB39ZJF1_DROSZ